MSGTDIIVFIYSIISLQGYKQKKAFIIAQGPLRLTVRNFWKTIYDCKCAVVVMTSGLIEEGQESSAQYWPSSGTYQYGEYAVDLIGAKTQNTIYHQESECHEYQGLQKLVINFPLLLYQHNMTSYFIWYLIGACFISLHVLQPASGKKICDLATT